MSRHPRQAVSWSLIFAQVLLVAACSNPITQVAAPAAPAQQELPTPTPVPARPAAEKPTFTVQRGDVQRQVQFSGRIAPVNETNLVFRSDGRVRTVAVQVDDTVKQGNVIAELQIDPLLRDLDKSKLALERAKVRGGQAQAQNDAAVASAQIDVDTARIRYEQLAAADPTPHKTLAQAALNAAQQRYNQIKAGPNSDSVTAAKAQLEKAQAVVQQAQAAYDKVAGRPDVGATQQSVQLQQATIDLQTAQANYRIATAGATQADLQIALSVITQAQANYDLALQQATSHDFDLQLAQKDIAKKQQTLDTLKQTGLDPLLKNDVDAAQLDVQRLEAQAAEARLIAPFDAQVLSVRMQPGQAVKAYDPQIVVGNPSQLEVSAEVASKDLPEISAGQPATVTGVSGAGKQYVATVRRLPSLFGSAGASGSTDEADKTTRLSLAQVPPEFIIGTLVRVTVNVERKNSVLWLPPEYIRSFEGRRFVVVQDGKTQKRIDIKVGLESKDRVEVQSGLEQGQIVVAQ